MTAATTAEAPALSFEIEGRAIEVELPPPGHAPSVMVLGLPKAGSTLLHGMMEAIAAPSGLTYFALAQKMYTSGVLPPQVPAEATNLFVPEGYLFGGFRGVPPKVDLPAWASGRTILLVRDPRDMLTSLYFSHAVSHGPPGGGSEGGARTRFEQQRVEAQTQTIDEFALDRSKLISHIYRLIAKKTPHIDHKVYRYEDVIFDKVNWMQDIARTLKLSVDAETLNAAVLKYDVVPSKENPDKHVRRVTPGDFEEKLKPETIRQLDQIFVPIYARYGYKAMASAKLHSAAGSGMTAPAAVKVGDRKEIVLHIGMPKTGTTSIQGLLRKNESHLRSVGVLYPGGEVDPRMTQGVNHRAFFSALIGSNTPTSGMADLEECRGALFKSVDLFRTGEDLRTLVISHESLATRMKSIDRSIVDTWREEFDIAIVLYVRPMREWVESRYVQSIWGWANVRSPSGDRPMKPLSRTLMRSIHQFLPSTVVDGVKAVFPDARLAVQSFVQRRKNNDLIENFFQNAIPQALSIISLLKGEEQRRNPSRLSCNTMFMYHLQKGGAGFDTAHAIARALAQRTNRSGEIPPLAEKSYHFTSDGEFAELAQLDAKEAEHFPDLELDAHVARKDGATQMTEEEYVQMLEWIKPSISRADHERAAESFKSR